MTRAWSREMRHTALGLSLLPVLAFLVLAWFFVGYTVDDAFISMRYAQQLVAGHGLVFNTGERVEGFSNPLWVGLLAIAALAGVDAWIAAKLLGVFAGGITILLLATRKQDGARLGAWLAASCGGFAYYAVSGLEPALMAALLVALAVAWRDEPSWVRVFVLAFLAIAVAATRPEGVLTLAAFALLVWWRWPRGRAGVASATLISMVLLLLVARHSYYGAWLPNTYLAKPGISDFAGLVAGLDYCGRALTEDQRWADMLMVAGAALRMRRVRAHLGGLMLVSGVGFAVWSGGDWMERSRFLVPYLPLLAWFAGDAIAAESRRRTKSLAPAIAVVALLALLRATSALGFAGDLAAGGVFDHAHVSTGNVTAARWLAERGPKNAVVIADEIGAIGYLSGYRVLDFWGLIDVDVAAILREHDFNPYAGATSAASRSAAQRAIARRLIAKGATLALIDERGPTDGPLVAAFANPATMRELVAELEASGWTIERRFVLDRRAPKSFLLMRKPE